MLDDAPALARVHVACWHETYAGLLPDSVLASLSVERRTATWQKILSVPASFDCTMVYVAEHAGTIVGFGACGAQRSSHLRDDGYDGEISAIYIRREFQHRGIGTALMREMFSSLEKHGHRAASAWVLRENAPARNFYENCGAISVSEREDMHGDTVVFEVAYAWQQLAWPSACR